MWVRANLGAGSTRPDPDGGYDPPSDNAMNTGPYYVIRSQTQFTRRIYRD